MNIIKTRKAYAAKIQKAEEDLKKLTREKEAFEAYASHVGGEPKATRTVKAAKTSTAGKPQRNHIKTNAKIRDKKPAKPQRKSIKAPKATKSIKAPKAKAVKGGGGPRLVDSIRDALGSRTLNAKEVYEALKTKGLLPTSNDPLAYIRAVLNRRNNFQPDKARGRGYYKNIVVSTVEAAGAKAKKAPKPRQPKAPKAATASFESYGVQDPTVAVGSNPFSTLGRGRKIPRKGGPTLAPLSVFGVGLALKTPSPERLYHVLL